MKAKQLQQLLEDCSKDEAPVPCQLSTDDLLEMVDNWQFGTTGGLSNLVSTLDQNGVKVKDGKEHSLYKALENAASNIKRHIRDYRGSK